MLSSQAGGPPGILVGRHPDRRTPEQHGRADLLWRIAMTLICVGVLAALAAPEPDLTCHGAPRHPTVYVAPDDVARARQRIASDPQAKAWFESLQRQAAPWKDKDAAWVRSVMPGPGACFAYGFTGCPICGSAWGIWGAARASFDKPGCVTCAKGHVLPDADHADAGAGYTAPDKRIHYFVGSYNAWVVEALVSKIADPYATIYLLTDDQRAGRMTAVILDELARIYPSCDKGSWDYPSNPPSGRLNRPWYQVARVLVRLVDIYDRVYHHPALDEPSSVPGLTRRQNIERNMLLNGAKYCYQQSTKSSRLHNGEADYLRGVLAVGVVLGIDDYIKCPVDGPYGIRSMIANNIDRDGRYFETSTGYSLHTRNLYLTFSEPLLNYRGGVFPQGLNLYDDPRYQAFLLLPQLAMVGQGHDAPFGDDAPAITQSKPPYRPARVYDLYYAEVLAARVAEPNRRLEYQALRAYLSSNYAPAEGTRAEATEWKVFHAPDAAASAPGAEISGRSQRWLKGSFVFGQEGLAVMRRDDGRPQEAILRFGPSLNHGHCDDLNVNYFAQGYELTYDIGYSLGSTHTQVGWAHQTASHNVVVVDENSQGGGSSGGSVYHFAAMPGMTVSDASSTAYAHRGVNIYRRLIALADGYALDVFRVQGGKRHDLPMHALTSNIAFDGLALGSEQPGSLAGREYEWGNLQLNDGDMKGHPNRPYWNPPPGNGYGFLVHTAAAEPKANWSATWTLPDKSHFEMLALAAPGEQVVSATAPGLYPTNPKAAYAVRRCTGENLSSCFVSLWQSTAKTMPVRSIQRVDSGSALTADSALAVDVTLEGDRHDLWLVAPDNTGRLNGKLAEGPFVFEGALARCRLDADGLAAVDMLDARQLDLAGWKIRLDEASRSAAVAGLPAGSVIPIDADWPRDGRYDGDTLYVSNPGYSRNSAYTIAAAAQEGIRVEQADTLLGRGTIEKILGPESLWTRIPHEYACCMGNRTASTFFQGKLLRTDDGSAATHIRATGLGNGMQIGVKSSAGFRLGQAFDYHDVQPGDTVTVHNRLSLVRLAPDRYQLTTNADITLTAPGGARVHFTDAAGLQKDAAGGRISRGTLAASGQTAITIEH
jgi:hypothetical protein